MNTSNQQVDPLILETYLAIIKNSVKSKMFRNFYAKVNNKKTDIMKKGDLSCAFYVSSVLVLFQLINKIHATVDGLVEDLEKSGWREIKTKEKLKIGDVLIWEEVVFKKNDKHKHIGFFMGNNRAISNSSRLRFPVEHHFTFRDKRKIEKIFRKF